MEARLTIVLAALAALAVSRRIEPQTGWSIRRFVKTARRSRTSQIQAGQHTTSASGQGPGGGGESGVVDDPDVDRCAR